MKPRNVSLYEDQRMTMKVAIETSLVSLRAYGSDYDHWSIAYSGGKDSSATVAFVVWAIETGQVQRPETLTVLYADTRQELPSLTNIANRFMTDLRKRGVDARVVLPDIDNRFYVYMLGRGVPPPSNTFRWCTERIKIKPMLQALERQAQDRRFLQVTGVRQGESAARDARIQISCNSNSGECGQGWFQAMSSDSIADSLAPIVHWRTCYVWDWLYFWAGDSMATRAGYERGHGFGYLGDIAAVYGDDEETRTGCIGCNLTNKQTALHNSIARNPKLKPLLDIKGLFRELKKPQHRIRKAAPERTKSGAYAKNGQRMGPLTMEARAYGLERVLDIQRRAKVNLINADEEARIRELWALNTWPQGWEDGLQGDNHIRADVPIDQITVVGDNELVVQPSLFGCDK